MDGGDSGRHHLRNNSYSEDRSQLPAPTPLRDNVIDVSKAFYTARFGIFLHFLR